MRQTKVWTKQYSCDTEYNLYTRVRASKSPFPRSRDYRIMSILTKAVCEAWERLTLKDIDTADLFIMNVLLGAGGVIRLGS